MKMNDMEQKERNDNIRILELKEEAIEDTQYSIQVSKLKTERDSSTSRE